VQIKVASAIVGVMLFALLTLSAGAQQSIEEWEAEGIALEKETGIPRLPLPNNIPPQEPAPTGLTNCTVSAAGHTSFVSIWLRKEDCDAWLKVAMAFNQKYGEVLGQVKARHAAVRNKIEEAKRQQQAGPGKRITYALFLCFKGAGVCELQGAPRMTAGGFMPGVTFETLAECQENAKRAGGGVPPSEGRFFLPNSMWYECRWKSVDTWQRVQ
jgi:hypothetical protein